MMRSRLSPREIVQRLQMIETLTVEGLPVAEALRSVGMREAEYDRWRVEYNGLGRTLGPLVCATPKPVKRTRRAAPAHPRKPPVVARRRLTARARPMLSPGSPTCDGGRGASTWRGKSAPTPADDEGVLQ